ncbi:hypothetical protein ACHAXA_009494 [Cyclostephanos tholiformis]|uniref:DUF6824 domain-containing protein n=1 Tax=Cyclostephanos tholiformis TaxID=382380 RepID=A0ABD3RFE1_9STRA
MQTSQVPPPPPQSSSLSNSTTQQPQSQQQQLKTNITTTSHNNDVLCGRGCVVNSHPGNVQYREIVERKKRIYLTARFKREKRLIASSIVEEVHSMNPPGRFLMKDPVRNDVWQEIGDDKALQKTYSTLRENAVNVWKQMEEEIKEKSRLQQQQEAEDEDGSGVDRDGLKEFVDTNAVLTSASSSGGLPTSAAVRAANTDAAGDDNDLLLGYFQSLEEVAPNAHIVAHRGG